MPVFLDRHEMRGVTAADIAEAHRKDLEIEAQYGVRFLTYWFDADRGTTFCLIDAPDRETVRKVHGEAHGNLPTEIIEVELSAVEAFLGRISDPQAQAGPASPALHSGLRAVLFTDLVESTAMTQRLGDTMSVEMVRAHDALVRRELGTSGGREIKHTGDGIMASFGEAPAAVDCACGIQKGFEAFNLASAEKLRVRIGIDIGEPVEDSHDLFGQTVQMAARLCAAAEPDTILVSSRMRELVPTNRALKAEGLQQLKGFDAPIEAYTVVWR